MAQGTTRTDDGMPAMGAIWGAEVVAESNVTIAVEGSDDVPVAAARGESLQPSTTRTGCPWNGPASYVGIVVGSKRDSDATWTYPAPTPFAKRTTGRIAFSNAIGVQPVRTPDPNAAHSLSKWLSGW